MSFFLSGFNIRCEHNGSGFKFLPKEKEEEVHLVPLLSLIGALIKYQPLE